MTVKIFFLRSRKIKKNIEIFYNYKNKSKENKRKENHEAKRKKNRPIRNKGRS